MSQDEFDFRSSANICLTENPESGKFWYVLFTVLNNQFKTQVYNQFGTPKILI